MHNEFIQSPNTKYVKLLNASKELKRLQKEIDEANEWFLYNSALDFDPEWQEKYNTKKINQSKIKQLIEEL